MSEPPSESIQASRATVNPMDLTGRTILVTGGSSGIGRGTAILLSQLGARVIVVGRSPEKLEETMSALAGDGHRAESFDLSQVEAIPAWLEKLAAQTGPLHGIVHSAGVTLSVPLRALSMKAVREMMAINVEASIMLARGYRRKNVCAKGGSLVFVASVAAMRGAAGLAAYAASKGAVLSLAKSLAVELVPDGLRVNTVVPSFVDTPMYVAAKNLVGAEHMDHMVRFQPLGLGQPVDVANSIAFLLSDAARWITGEAVVVDGGFLA